MLKAHLEPLLQICKEQNTDFLSSLVRGKDRGVKSKNTSMVLSDQSQKLGGMLS